MEDKKKFMAKAIELSINSANTNGGPFGSVIVKAVSYTHLTLPTILLV